MERRALIGLKPVKTSDAAGPPQASYMRMPTVTANVARPGGQRGVMTVETGIDAPDAALRARAAQSVPRLRAAYAAVVQRSASTLRPGLPPDVERLVVELQAATNATLGRPGARLLIGTVMVV